MKTTVEIDDLLLRAAKRAAVERGTTLRAMLESGLRRELATSARRRLKLVTVPGGAPEGIESREQMWEWLDYPR
ncbi:MAG: hypothetical protein ACRD2D_01645 [Terriglobales bacterium]